MLPFNAGDLMAGLLEAVVNLRSTGASKKMGLQIQDLYLSGFAALRMLPGQRQAALPRRRGRVGSAAIVDPSGTVEAAWHYCHGSDCGGSLRECRQ
jgi:hypothetical protein